MRLPLFIGLILSALAQEPVKPLPPVMPKLPAVQLKVETNGGGEILSLRWTGNGRESDAVSDELMAIVKADPKALLVSPRVGHAAILIPFGHRRAPLGDVVMLNPGTVADFSRDGKGLIDQEPTLVGLSRWGLFFTRNAGSKYTIEHYDIAKNKIEVLQELEAAQVGSVHKVKLGEDAATVVSDGKSVDYRPNGRKAESTLVYHDLAIGNIDVIEGTFGGVELTKKALDGQLDPDESEVDLAVQMAENIRRNRLQKSVLLWGVPGTDNRGVVHLFAQKVAQAKKETPNFGFFEGWKIYQLGWSKFNAEGLVDVATNKATSLVDAAKQKKVILVFDQVEQIVGLGSDKGNRSDVASVLLGAMKNSEIILIGTTSSEGVPFVRSRREFFDQFTEVQISEPKGDRLLLKLKLAAERKKAATRVSFSDDTLKLIVDVTDRYLSDKGQPEKSLGAIEALIAENSPLRTAEPGTEPEDLAIVEVDSKKVMTWIAKAARIGTLAVDAGDTLTKFILTKEYDTAMDKRMSGQKKAKEAVRDSLLSIAKGMRGTNSQGNEIGIETLLFVGPSGTGKSFLHEVLSKVLAEKNINLPYEEPIEGSTLVDGDQAVRTLIGAAPGYVGYDASGEGGLLYQMVKRSPQAILVLEEFDKVDEKVDKVLYSFLDSAKIVNSSGKTARFTRGLFILTANFGVEGSGGATNRARLGADAGTLCNYIDRWDRHHLFASEKDDPKSKLYREDKEVASWNEETLRVSLFNCLKENKLINPQILGRIGRSNLVIFHHFTRPEIEIIRDQQLAKVEKEYLQSHKAKLVFSDAVKKWLFQFAWGDDGMLTFNVGARAIVDTVKAEINKPLLRFAALGGDDVKGKTWKIDLDEAQTQATVVAE